MDSRWDDVYGTVETEEIPDRDLKIVWFRIVLVLDGQRYTQNYRIHEYELDAFHDLYGHILDKMVKKLEEAISRNTHDQSV